ncbi:MAG: FliA/WhiG family RNA polymerase sigma factor [Candidatus Binatia bacterium]|nr:FliA/WhiG family RNA polymerase sigma factor [Candidatus Binatia bacterium]
MTSAPSSRQSGLAHRSEDSQAHIPSQADPRAKMLEAYLPQVRLVAERTHRRLPPGIDLESLVHAGVMGLLEALQRYDPRRGVAFHAYARYRIQGEIMEYLRSLDWVSRSVRAWGRKVAAVRDQLAGRLGREATAQEIAAELGISLQEYYRIDQKVSEGAILSLEDLAMTSEEDWHRAKEHFARHPFVDPLALLEQACDPLTWVEGKDLVEKLTAAIAALPERERLVVTLYYHEELTFREIGEILDLSEGRICQLHAQAVARLRQALGGKAAAHGKENGARSSSRTARSVGTEASVRVA